MHSPEVLAHRIKSPFWRTLKFANGKSHRVHDSIIEIWHIEPNGADALTICQKRYKDKDGKWHYSKGWKWHFWHWQISPSILYKWRRRLFTRCAECGGPSRKGHLVNHSNAGWDGAPKTPLWCGEIKLYHSECLAKVSKQAHHHDPRNCYQCKKNAEKTEASRVIGGLFENSHLAKSQRGK